MVYPALPIRGFGRTCLNARFRIRSRPSTAVLRQFHASRATFDQSSSSSTPTGTTARSAAAAERLQNLAQPSTSDTYAPRSTPRFASRILSKDESDMLKKAESAARMSRRSEAVDDLDDPDDLDDLDDSEFSLSRAGSDTPDFNSLEEGLAYLQEELRTLEEQGLSYEQFVNKVQEIDEAVENLRAKQIEQFLEAMTALEIPVDYDAIEEMAELKLNLRLPDLYTRADAGLEEEEALIKELEQEEDGEERLSEEEDMSEEEDLSEGEELSEEEETSEEKELREQKLREEAVLREVQMLNEEERLREQEEEWQKFLAKRMGAETKARETEAKETEARETEAGEMEAGEMEAGEMEAGETDQVQESEEGVSGGQSDPLTLLMHLENELDDAIELGPENKRPEDIIAEIAYQHAAKVDEKGTCPGVSPDEILMQIEIPLLYHHQNNEVSALLFKWAGVRAELKRYQQEIQWHKDQIASLENFFAERDKLSRQEESRRELTQEEYGDGDVEGIYSPKRFTVKDLVRGHAAVLAGPRGAQDVLSERMNMLGERRDRDWASEDELARRLMKGEIVRFKNEAEKASVLELCEEIAANTAVKVSRKRGTEVKPIPVGFTPISKDGRKVVLDKVVRGQYSLMEDESAGVPKELEAVQRYTSLNPTYAPGNQSRILSKLTERYARSAKDEQARKARMQAARSGSK